MKTHELKTWVVPFKAVWDGKKTYEIRENDRGFAVGDMLKLREFKPHKPCAGSGRDGCETPHGQYTGREFTAKVTYMTPGGEWGLPEAVCVLGLRKARKAIREPSKPVRKTRLPPVPESLLRELESFRPKPVENPPGYPDGWNRSYRSDRGIFENICPHGIGHPAKESIKEEGDGIHGCDGCCGKAGAPA